MTPFKPARLAVVALRAEDVHATALFYRDVLGLSLLPHHGQRPAFDLGHGACLVIVQGRPEGFEAGRETRFPAIAFAVHDLDAAVSHLQDHQVDLPWGVEAEAGSRWVQFLDPAGNLVELVQFSAHA
jgi:catechol-2,3-dioxygenase